VKVLLKAGADVNARNHILGDTALLAASANGHLEVMKELLRHGADVDAKDRAGMTSLMRAASVGHVDVLKALLAAGADVNAGSNGGDTPLMYAVMSGSVDAVRVILNAGADIKRENNSGNTALGIVRRGRPSSLRGGKWEIITAWRRSYNKEIAQLLEQTGAQ
jgi:ankyrin repeat protein